MWFHERTVKPWQRYALYSCMRKKSGITKHSIGFSPHGPRISAQNSITIHPLVESGPDWLTPCSQAAGLIYLIGWSNSAPKVILWDWRGFEVTDTQLHLFSPSFHHKCSIWHAGHNPRWYLWFSFKTKGHLSNRYVHQQEDTFKKHLQMMWRLTCTK